MKAVTFLFPQLSNLLIKHPQVKGFAAKWKQKKRDQLIFKLKMEQITPCQHSLPYMKEFINLLYQHTAILNSSSSSNAHRICTCSFTGASGFKSRVTGTMVVIQVSVFVDKCFEVLQGSV